MHDEDMALASATTDGQLNERNRSKSSGSGRVVLELLAILFAALVVTFLLKTFVVQSYFVPSASMESTLQVGDHLLVPDWRSSPVDVKRGDIVVFTDPGGWITPSAAPTPSSPLAAVLTFIGLQPQDSNNHLIKRIIGLPGDTVMCCSASGLLEVNGTPITEPYILGGQGNANADRYQYAVKVPKGMLWVLGDNRFDSADSAYHYSRNDPHIFVPESAVDGIATIVSWPITRWRFLDNYPSVFARVNHPGPTIVQTVPTAAPND